ncbi:uncharacterized protein N7482_009535 [Penicillium canariense]|uniref:Carboxylic ester hydrolase n=1 Tax=Penicillium canariense TaxID=189055 RepID=A0A9W9HQD4_9EURO|nr:uncharacterized protein N7482_009535 [Penicillium canariense]KAJ5153057.1 hypothetical protein N7482_009535 [Penicillium canariense]
MHFHSLLTGLAVSAILTGAEPIPRSSSKHPIIKTTKGSVQGIASEYREDITVYKGIPFAASTAGENRWKAPSAREPWSGVLKADAFGPQCAQTTSSSAGIFNTASNISSEDCLYLNIWTPTFNDQSDLTSKKLPVYVWIYGGRFEAGSGDVATYDGSGLASKDIIVVTLNYRVGAFGFLAHPALSAESGHNSSGNYGLLDQQFALRWVKENIAKFGGNPDQVTVGGQSAGSASSLDMMYSPLSKNLINGVISESGARGPHDPVTGSAATSYRTKAAAEAYGVKFQKELNATSISDLRKLSMDTLISYGSASDTTFQGTQFENLTSSFMDPPVWRPVIDGYVLAHTYGEALNLDAHADVPILTGNNKDESGASLDPGMTVASYKKLYSEMFEEFAEEFFTLYPANNVTEANENSNELFRDLSRVGTWRWAVDWAAGGAKSNVYTYYWTHTPAENPSAGAYHGSELWYVFNNIPYSDYSNVTWTVRDYKIQDEMSEYWANFIKTGNPNGNGLTYFPPTTETKQTMWLGNSWGAGPLSKSDARINFLRRWEATLKQY